MSSNQFTSWPLWHYFSLHFQNLGAVDDAFRTYSVSGKVVNPMEDAVLSGPISTMVFYDFMNDVIVPASRIPNLTVVDFPSFSDARFAARIPGDTNVLVKGVASTRDGRVSGGELIPLIGTKEKMQLVLRAILEQIRISRNVAGAQVFDIFGALSEQEQARVTALLARPEYSNLMMSIIRNSYERTATSSLDIESIFTKIRNRLTKPIPDMRAINVSSGSLVSAANCYNIIEMSVIPEAGAESRNVRFAFRNNLKESDREALLRLLRERFSAQTVRATEPSAENRATIAMRPVQVSAETYSRLLPNLSFQQYIAQANRVTQAQAVESATYTLQSEIQTEEDPELDEVEEEEALDDY